MKRSTIVTTLVLVGLLVMSAAYSMAMSSRPKEAPKQNQDGVTIVQVDKVARDPKSYKGDIGIEGDVLKVYEAEKKFLLSCGDSCVRLPVQFDGELPKEKAKVTVYGEIKTSEEGGYVFVAKKVDVK